MAMSASTALRGFFLSGSLLEVSQQPVGLADRHPSENIKGEERISHNVTHQHTNESETSMKISLHITYTQ
jgi:hypothetical protein